MLLFPGKVAARVFAVEMASTVLLAAARGGGGNPLRTTAAAIPAGYHIESGGEGG